MEVIMRSTTKPRQEHSPLDILTELAVEGTSSLVEAERALLDLAQRENDIILNGVKERIGGFVPAVAMTDLVRRSLDTLIGMQHELLTTTSKQTLQWLESEKTGKGDRTTRLVEFARDGVEAFTRAQKKFLDAVSQEAAKASSKHEHADAATQKTELTHLAQEAGDAFIEAQKRLLDVMGQQMNVNLDVTARAMQLVSPSRLQPIADLTGEGVRNFVDQGNSLIGTLIKQPKKLVGRGAPGRARRPRRRKTVLA
jgi:hypothetical protein